MMDGEVGGWKLEDGYWIMDYGLWMMDDEVGSLRLEVGGWIMDYGLWMMKLEVGSLRLEVEGGTLNLKLETWNPQHATCNQELETRD